MFYNNVYLSVKRVAGELIVTLECVSVGLIHDQAVFEATEDFGLVDGLWTRHQSMRLLSSHCDSRLPFPGRANSRCLLLIRVLVDHFWEPEMVNVLFGKGVQGGHYSLTPSTFPPYVFDTFTPCE